MFSILQSAALPNSAVMFVVLIVLFLAVMAAGYMLLLARQYKRCPSSRVLVIWGRGNRAGERIKLIHGGNQFVMPLLEDYAYLSLEPIHVKVQLHGVQSREGTGVDVSGEFLVAIDTETAVLQQAAKHLLGLTVSEIRRHAQEIVAGQLRKVMTSLGASEILRNPNLLLEHLQPKLEPELGKIGLELLSASITDVADATGTEDVVRPDKASLMSSLRQLLEQGLLSSEDRDEIRRLL